MSYIAAADFLAGITGQASDYDVPGLGLVRLRGLTALEFATIRSQHPADGMSQAMAVVAQCMVEPALSFEQIGAVALGRAGTIEQIATRVMQLSGVVVDEDLEKKVGGGS